MLKHVALLLLGTQICAVNPGLQTWERGADADGASSVYASEADIDWGRRDEDGASSVYPSDVSEISKSKTGQKGKYIPSVASTEQGEEEEVDPRLFMQFNKEERNMNWGRGDADGASSAYPSDVSEISKSKTGQKGKYIPSIASTEQGEEESIDPSLFVRSYAHGTVSQDWERRGDADGASSIYPSEANSSVKDELLGNMPSNKALMDGLNKTAISLKPTHPKSPKYNASESSIDTNDYDDSKSPVINYDESPNKNHKNDPHTPDQSGPRSHSSSTPKTPRNPVGKGKGPNAKVLFGSKTPETVRKVRVTEPDAELNRSLSSNTDSQNRSFVDSILAAGGKVATEVFAEKAEGTVASKTGNDDTTLAKLTGRTVTEAGTGATNGAINRKNLSTLPKGTNQDDCCAGCTIS